MNSAGIVQTSRRDFLTKSTTTLAGAALTGSLGAVRVAGQEAIKGGAVDLPVLPKPQQVVLDGGTVSRHALRNVAASAQVPGALEKHVEAFARANRLERARAEGAGIVIEPAPNASPHREGYTLRIGEQIVLRASDFSGFFYGLQTLQQLLNAGPLIPRCTITDWPALAVRGFYFDLTRQVPKPEFLRSIVDRLAAAKINLLMIQYREFFPYEGFPLIVSKASYTRNEIAEFIAYARDRCIQVVPLLQSLSFQEHILRARAYAHLREQPQSIVNACPSHPEWLQLYCSLAEELIAAHPNVKYFHIGADEAQGVGSCERCKKANPQGSPAAIMTGFTNKVVRFLVDRGVTPMMWADMLFGHFVDKGSADRFGRDMMRELSRDIVAADWDYWSTGLETPPAAEHPYRVPGLTHVQRLLDAGFRVVGVPSCSSSGNADRNAIDHVLAFDNISAYAEVLRRQGCLGMITTHWPTDAESQVQWQVYVRQTGSSFEVADVAYRQVRPGLEAHWRSIWRGAECAWSSSPRPSADFDRAFVQTFLETEDTSYPEALVLASLSMKGYHRTSPGRAKELMPEAVSRMRKARGSAKRSQATVAYSDLFVRLQRHSLEWDTFEDQLPSLRSPRLSDQKLRALRNLAAEREALEREFHQQYLSLYKDVHLAEEVRVRFAEERRLQEQLLLEQKRRG